VAKNVPERIAAEVAKLLIIKDKVQLEDDLSTPLPASNPLTAVAS